ncbi:DNA-binding transcriptional MerR regulator [Muricomes intestini]|uniref:DNA-binding transcriptional MerR regulator n=1 Tax=Muricomes intestini TaxID=1796634 RepID=A0A4R3JZR7_9FIRM|nr:MerR family transcriptional regulator [Muricomes intestini]TCS74711.1 DNA-binding transcriptional MerR regulator [Muricomes intestini]
MKKKYSIGDVSKLFQVAKSTLRYWDAENLIQLERNENNDYRVYTLRELLTILDITLYRKLNMPVKKLKEMYQWDVDAWEDVLCQEIQVVNEKIKSLREIKKNLQSRKDKLQQVEQLQKHSFTESEPDIDKIVFYQIDDSYLFNTYLQNPYNFIIYLSPDMDNSEFIPIYGMSVSAITESSNVIWEREENNKKYMQCLLRVTREEPYNTNLDEIRKNLEKQGYKTGAIIGRFLATAKELVCYDFYKVWVEII